MANGSPIETALSSSISKFEALSTLLHFHLTKASQNCVVQIVSFSPFSASAFSFEEVYFLNIFLLLFN